MQIGDLVKISSHGGELDLLGIYLGYNNKGEYRFYYSFDAHDGGEFADFDQCFWIMEVI